MLTSKSGAPVADTCLLGKRCLCGGLPPRQRQVLHRLLAGDGEKQVALTLGVSRDTIHSHLKNLYRHFNVNGRLELMALAVEAAAAPANRPRAVAHDIGLDDLQQRQLQQLISNTSGATRKQILHAQILLHCDGQWNDYDIAARLDVAVRTVERVRKIFTTQGIAAAIAPRIQPPRPHRRNLDPSNLAFQVNRVTSA